MSPPRSLCESPHGDLAGEEKSSAVSHDGSSPGEKHDHDLESIKSEDATFAPINASATHGDQSGAPLQKQRSSASRSLERGWSLNDGMSTGGTDVEREEADEAGRGAEGADGYIVGWDERDPMNPRNMNKARRWLIVIIVSLGSLCV